MKKIMFVAWLFIGAASCLFTAGMDLYEKYEFWSGGRDGLMESTVPTKLLVSKTGTYAFGGVNVKYVTSDVEVFVQGKLLTGDLIKRLAQGEKIPVRFLDNNPSRVMFDNEVTPTPWGWLLVGLGLLGIAIYAWYLLRQEALQTDSGQNVLSASKSS